MDIQIDISGVALETKRLLLRPWREDDLDDLFEYASVDGVGEMAGWPHHTSKDESARILASFIDGKNVFAIEYKENKKVIGSLGLHESWANGDATYGALTQKEIGYVLSKDYWGLGLMPEAVSRVIDYCFGELKLEAVTVGRFKTNDQSRRVIEKCGFRFVKSDVYNANLLNKQIEDMRYILLKKNV